MNAGFDWSFFDYLWRGLMAGTAATFVIFAVFFVARGILVRKATRRQMRRFYNGHLVTLFVGFWLSFFWVAFADPELARGCFAQFAQHQSGFTMTRALAGLWLAGSAGFLFFDLSRILFFKVEGEAGSGELRNDFAKLTERFQLTSRRVQLVISPRQEGPYAVGVFRPKIVLPRRLLILSSDKIMHILAHELVHVRHRDTAWKYLDLLCRRLLFFHPVVYILSKGHEESLEKAADAEAISVQNIEARNYVSTLLELLELQSGLAPAPGALSVSKSFRETKSRIESLAQAPSAPRAWVNGAIGSALGVALSLSLWQAQASVQESAGADSERGLMCSQIQHEKVLESWLRPQAPPRSEVPVEASISQCE